MNCLVVEIVIVGGGIVGWFVVCMIVVCVDFVVL